MISVAIDLINLCTHVDRHTIRALPFLNAQNSAAQAHLTLLWVRIFSLQCQQAFRILQSTSVDAMQCLCVHPLRRCPSSLMGSFSDSFG